MLQAKITNIEKERHQATNTEFLDVAFDVIDENGDTVLTKRLGFDTNIKQRGIVKEVKRWVANHEAELKNEERDKEREVVERNVIELKKLEGELIDKDTDEEKFNSEIK